MLRNSPLWASFRDRAIRGYAPCFENPSVVRHLPQGVSRGSMHQSTTCETRELYDWVELVRSEFAEMPGLHLSKRQAKRLWNLDDRRTQLIFDTLESCHFLRRTDNDTYIRADIGC